MRTWDETFSYLIDYKNEYGNVNVPFNYIYKDIALGQWVALQRTYYRKGKMPQEHIDKFISIGFSFNTRFDTWNEYYELAKEYKDTYGNIDIPKRYVVEKDSVKYNLGHWLTNQRLAYSNRYKDRVISAEHIALLEKLGISWNCDRNYHQTSFNENAIFYYIKQLYPLAHKYRDGKIELDIYIPELNTAIEYDGCAWHSLDKDLKKNKYCFDNNITLYRVREIGCDVLHSTSIDIYISNNEELEDFIKGFTNNQLDVNISRDTQLIYDIFNTTISSTWFDKYALCVKYFKDNGNLNIPCTYVTDLGIKLGGWIREQRKSYKKNKLSNEKIELLNEINMIWKFA